MFRIELLAADYGDCLWIEYGDASQPCVVLIDGGPQGTYTRSLRPRLQQLVESSPAGRARIELLVVTHIDNDHILGVLDLLRDSTLNVEFGEIWFNGWEQIAPPDQLGVREGVALDKLIRQKRIPHNKLASGRAVQIDEQTPGDSYKLPGGLRLTVLSPGKRQLQLLRDEWEAVIVEAATHAGTAADLLGDSTAFDIRALADKRFKSDNAVANASSIALLAEYEDRRVLLTADSLAPVVQHTLESLGYGTENRLHLDAYKMSHHGSRGNNSIDLLRLIRCNRYLFSTSGSRFQHPHDECVARILVYGGKHPELFSNYPRDMSVLWHNAGVRRDYEYDLREPSGGDAGIALTL